MKQIIDAILNLNEKELTAYLMEAKRKQARKIEFEKQKEKYDAAKKLQKEQREEAVLEALFNKKGEPKSQTLSDNGDLQIEKYAAKLEKDKKRKGVAANQSSQQEVEKQSPELQEFLANRRYEKALINEARNRGILCADVAPIDVDAAGDSVNNLLTKLARLTEVYSRALNSSVKETADIDADYLFEVLRKMLLNRENPIESIQKLANDNRFQLIYDILTVEDGRGLLKQQSFAIYMQAIHVNEIIESQKLQHPDAQLEDLLPWVMAELEQQAEKQAKIKSDHAKKKVAESFGTMDEARKGYGSIVEKVLMDHPAAADEHVLLLARDKAIAVAEQEMQEKTRKYNEKVSLSLAALDRVDVSVSANELNQAEKQVAELKQVEKDKVVELNDIANRLLDTARSKLEIPVVDFLRSDSAIAKDPVFTSWKPEQTTGSGLEYFYQKHFDWLKSALDGDARFFGLIELYKRTVVDGLTYLRDGKQSIEERIAKGKELEQQVDKYIYESGIHHEIGKVSLLKKLANKCDQAMKVMRQDILCDSYDDKWVKRNSGTEQAESYFKDILNKKDQQPVAVQRKIDSYLLFKEASKQANNDKITISQRVQLSTQAISKIESLGVSLKIAGIWGTIKNIIGAIKWHFSSTKKKESILLAQVENVGIFNNNKRKRSYSLSTTRRESSRSVSKEETESRSLGSSRRPSDASSSPTDSPASSPPKVDSPLAWSDETSSPLAKRRKL